MKRCIPIGSGGSGLRPRSGNLFRGTIGPIGQIRPIKAFDCGDAVVFPRTGGTYALILKACRSRRVNIGRLGRLHVEQGFYVYVGSAFGPGGLQARLAHHFRRSPRPRWHIDYLKPHTRIAAAWVTEDPLHREHQWAAALAGMPGAKIHLRRFGASDCRCASHLFHFHAPPSPARFGLEAERRCASQIHPLVIRSGRCYGVGALPANDLPERRDARQMIAYFIHNSETRTDTIYLPQMGCFVPVDAGRMEAFISVSPDFESWSGESCRVLAPEEFGDVVASREDKGDVCVLISDLWQERMSHHLGDPLKKKG